MAPVRELLFRTMSTRELREHISEGREPVKALPLRFNATSEDDSPPRTAAGSEPAVPCSGGG